jgi:predicted house-cleaning noncanonical NTP pyrophosphatase (MazG superfamily)
VEEAAQEEETEELSDDLELVAVITAAIAASEGTSADGLVVRSIKRARNSQWKKA